MVARGTTAILASAVVIALRDGFIPLININGSKRQVTGSDLVVRATACHTILRIRAAAVAVFCHGYL